MLWTLAVIGSYIVIGLSIICVVLLLLSILIESAYEAWIDHRTDVIGAAIGVLLLVLILGSIIVIATDRSYKEEQLAKIRYEEQRQKSNSMIPVEAEDE